MSASDRPARMPGAGSGKDVTGKMPGVFLSCEVYVKMIS